ncbi:MAG: nucleotidyltransferase [Clostridia bacterium]|nr:nucleotidyltransferase [Clostridia bacterium]
MRTSLVILAAGLGSRFGKNGLKQITPVGPSGELIIDYSIHDAIEAGFDDIVFIIREEIADEFRRTIGDRTARKIPVSYAYQEITHLPDGYDAGKRTKPWGTGQALLACKGLVDGPFAVINADDYYGKEGFRNVHEFLVDPPENDPSALHLCMAGYKLSNTLSENGSVTRGVCRSEDGRLTEITETHNIENVEGRAAVISGKRTKFYPDDTLCSMNFWGIPAGYIDTLEAEFCAFLDSLQPGDLTSEFVLPTIIGRQIDRGEVDVAVLPTNDHWFGITYQDDKFATQEAFRKLVEAGVYPDNLIQ